MSWEDEDGRGSRYGHMALPKMASPLMNSTPDDESLIATPHLAAVEAEFQAMRIQQRFIVLCNGTI